MQWIFKVIIIFWVVCDCAYAQLAPRSLDIANPNPVGSGARAMGMGNAFIAIADDATAASWNPAGLTLMTRPEMSLAVENISFSEESHTAKPVTDHFNLADFNFASIVFRPNFGKKTDGRNTVFSINYFTLFRFDKSLDLSLNQSGELLGFPVIQTANYNLDNEGSLSALTPALGVVVSDNVFLGLSLNIWNHHMTGNSTFRKTELTTGQRDFGGGVTLATNPLLDKNTYEVDEGYSFVIGLQYQPSAPWSFGFVVKPDYDLKLDHKRIVIDSEGGIATKTLDQRLNAKLEFPWIIGFGVVWEPSKDKWKISTDITWTQWSKYNFRERGENKNPLSADSSDSKDTYTIRFGYESLHELKKLIIPFRWGLGYDPAPSINSVDDFYTVSVGSGIQFRDRVILDLAYEFRWGKNVNSATIAGFIGSQEGQDVQRHRLLMSLLFYF